MTINLDEYWRKIEHTWTDYRDNATVVCIEVHAADGQFWAGNYGTKIAGTSIEVKLEFNKHPVSDS